MKKLMFGGDILTDEDVIELNQIFNKNYTKEKWESLEILYLETLPEKQFPKSFNKLKNLISVDLLHKENEITCVDDKDLILIILKYMHDSTQAFLMGENAVTRKICLNGNEYEIFESSKGTPGSAEGYLCKIRNKNGQIYVLKIYVTEFMWMARNDLLVLKKARQSKELLCMPYLVNTKYGYSIFPELDKVIGIKRDASKVIDIKIGMTADQIMLKFDENLLPKLAADGLMIGDFHVENYMYDYSGNIKRIDYGSVKEIKQ